MDEEQRQTTGVVEPASLAGRKREFLPLYEKSGNEEIDRLQFFHILERLKTQKRTGWVDSSVPDAESISDHMYRMAVLSMCTSDESLDIGRCVQLSIVHDLAEAQVGDITPREGISKEEKRKLEREAMNNFCESMLHNSVAASRILSLWEEYEEQHTPEARFVKDLDRLEMALQADEYECRHLKKLQGFFDSSIPFLQHPEVKRWGYSLLQQREERESRYQSTN